MVDTVTDAGAGGKCVTGDNERECDMCDSVTSVDVAGDDDRGGRDSGCDGRVADLERSDIRVRDGLSGVRRARLRESLGARG
jgi:hypothetical protein